MKTDRKLLELAALAAGIQGQYVWNIDSAGMEQKNGAIWNPLLDDSEADRLEELLDLDVERLDGNATIAGHSSLETWPHEPDGNDRAAGRRRAIVRAAAEIATRATSQKNTEKQ